MTTDLAQGVQRVPNTATVDEVDAVLEEHGHVIIEELVAPETIDRLIAEMEMQPHIDATAFGESEGFGVKTRRTGRLIERSETARSLIMHPLVQGVLRKHMAHAYSYHGATLT